MLLLTLCLFQSNVKVSLNYKPSFTSAPAATNGSGESKSTKGGYVPPHKRNQVKASSDDADWFNDD